MSKVNKGNKDKARLLGMSFGKASNRLRKMVMFRLLVEAGKDVCFRCGEKIKDIEKLSLEHKTPWQQAANPVACFFDLDNVSFSHTSCNYKASHSAITQCPHGHLYTKDNTYMTREGGRACRACHNTYRQEYRYKHPEQQTQEYRRNKGWIK